MAIRTERVPDFGRDSVRDLGPRRAVERFSKKLIFYAMWVFFDPVERKPRVTKLIELSRATVASQ